MQHWFHAVYAQKTNVGQLCSTSVLSVECWCTMKYVTAVWRSKRKKEMKMILPVRTKCRFQSRGAQTRGEREKKIQFSLFQVFFTHLSRIYHKCCHRYLYSICTTIWRKLCMRISRTILRVCQNDSDIRIYVSSHPFLPLTTPLRSWPLKQYSLI